MQATSISFHLRDKTTKVCCSGLCLPTVDDLVIYLFIYFTLKKERYVYKKEWDLFFRGVCLRSWRRVIFYI